jgi:hypothetical protein
MAAKTIIVENCIVFSNMNGPAHHAGRPDE